MSQVIDIALVAVFAFLIIRGTLRGFAKSLVGFARLALSFLITATLGGVFSDWINAAWLHAEGRLAAIGGSILGHVLLFAFVYAVLSVGVYLIGRIVDLPVIKQCDRALGACLGGIVGLIAISCLAILLHAVLYVTSNTDVFDSSLVLRVVYELRVFDLI